VEEEEVVGAPVEMGVAKEEDCDQLQEDVENGVFYLPGPMDGSPYEIAIRSC
jgi:hypothetical protein